MAVWSMVVVEQCGGLVVNPQDHVAAVAAGTAVGTAQRLEFLTLNGDTAMATGTAGYMQYYPVYEARHVFLLCV
jgi:hypothetical protein